MATLPTPGGDLNTHGAELNTFLSISLAADGKIKDGAEQTTSAAPTADAEIANKKYVDDQNDSQTSGLIKAYCAVNVAGTLQDGSFNVSGSAKNSTGNYTVTWDTDFADNTYNVVGNAFGAITGVFNLISKTTGSCVIEMREIGVTNKKDIKFNLMAIGTQ